jgi:hypothetical protein
MKTKVLFCCFLAFALYMLPFSAIGKGEVIDLEKWKEMIVSKDYSEMEKGRNLLVQDREQQIEYLLSVVSEPVTPGESYYYITTPRNTAIYLLGHLRAKEAVPVLIERLTPLEGQSFVIWEMVLLCPAADALGEIGIPAVKPLLDELKKEELAPYRNMYLMTIITILGPELTEVLLKKEVKSSRNEGVKYKLKGCLELLDKNKIPAGVLMRAPW